MGCLVVLNMCAYRIVQTTHREHDRQLSKLTMTATANLDNVAWALTTRVYKDQGMANIRLEGLTFVLVLRGQVCCTTLHCSPD